MLKKILMGIFIVLTVLVIAFQVMLYVQAVNSRSMEVPSGHDNGQLLPCPESPNCVSSQVPESDSHYIAPIVDNGSTWVQLIAFLDSQDNTEQHTLDENYAHYTFSTPVMGFVDDVEFFFSANEGVIHVRSASRVGYGDGGTNRNRIEMIRADL